MTPEELYNQTIASQRDYLVKLQEAFNKRCDEIATITNQKLSTLPETDIEGRKKIFDEQKKLLDEALTQLKNEVTRSGTETRHKLEGIYAEREISVIANLENDIKKLK
jgi:hypothetical protein